MRAGWQALAALVLAAFALPLQGQDGAAEMISDGIWRAERK